MALVKVNWDGDKVTSVLSLVRLMTTSLVMLAWESFKLRLTDRVSDPPSSISREEVTLMLPAGGSVTVTLTVLAERTAPLVAVGLAVMVALSLLLSLSGAALTVTV